eukprot:TRINITY_DN1842_c0_g1_i4.p2 TRINITY_DN1842_c0_g1~~TRINITY_DN1842_c0_g1_i4.p2  ORF type:complete len:278 (+),score=54.86 TRINITY_DN1842_c0_g1_i4:962-1795(+)
MTYWTVVSPEDLLEVDKTELEEYLSQNLIHKIEEGDTSLPVSIEEYLSLTLTDEELVDHLCHLDQQLINSITCKILFEEPSHISHHTNMITRWVVQEILTTPLIKERAKKINRFISLSIVFLSSSTNQQNLQLRENYNSLFAIVNGLTLFSITRLKSTWKKVSSKKVKELSFLETLCSPKSNFGSLQALARESSSDRMIPFLLPNLVNISRIREITDLDEGSNMVPVSKLTAYQKIFNNITKYTRHIPANNTISITDTILSLEHLDELSFSTEPQVM